MTRLEAGDEPTGIEEALGIELALKLLH